MPPPPPPAGLAQRKRHDAHREVYAQRNTNQHIRTGSTCDTTGESFGLWRTYVFETVSYSETHAGSMMFKQGLAPLPMADRENSPVDEGMRKQCTVAFWLMTTHSVHQTTGGTANLD